MCPIRWLAIDLKIYTNFHYQIYKSTCTYRKTVACPGLLQISENELKAAKYSSKRLYIFCLWKPWKRYWNNYRSRFRNIRRGTIDYTGRISFSIQTTSTSLLDIIIIRNVEMITRINDVLWSTISLDIEWLFIWSNLKNLKLIKTCFVLLLLTICTLNVQIESA